MAEPVTESGVRGTLERALIRLDEPPWEGVWRAAAGLLWSASVDRAGMAASAAVQLGSLVGLLALLRVVPLVLRRLLPFSRETKRVWSERRQIAQRYDSYQWKKVLWLGLGIGLQAALSGDLLTLRGCVAAIGIVAGAFGWFAWQAKAPARGARPTSSR